jgi:hypothetical protein
VWTYFSVAEAHQWLLLGQLDHVESTLDWYFAHSSSPGLYSWWEGLGEENTSFAWEAIRGFVVPNGVSPHYWTAAEMLLLQMDMLAYVDDGEEGRPVVVGAGVPPAWLEQEMDSGTVHTTRGPVSWTFRQGVLEVTTEGDSIPLRISPVFAGAKIVRRSSTPAKER